MLGLFAAVWGKIAPIVALIRFIRFLLGIRPYSKLSITEFSKFQDRIFDDVVEFLKSHGLNREEFAPGSKEMYIERSNLKFKVKDGRQIRFVEGQIAGFFMEQFEIPTEERINKFLFHSFLRSNLKMPLFKYHFIKEKFLKFFTRKITSLHYFSISNWRNREYRELIREVKKVKKVELKLNEHYKFKREDVREDSKVASLIRDVLSEGKISSQTVLRLASTEKILMVYKYAEGFDDVFKEQRSDKTRMTREINELEKKSRLKKEQKEQLKSLKLELDKLEKNWITVPIGRELSSSKSFKKLFNKNSGIFFTPISMIPDKYLNNYEGFVNETIIKGAEMYFESIKGSKYLIGKHDGLSYLILLNVVGLNEILILSRNRTLNISSPHLASMVATSIMTSANEAAQLYINDIVKNVEFSSTIPNNSAGRYVLRNYDILKQILWDQLKIDIHKPVTLSLMSEDNISDVSQAMLEIDDSVQAFRLKRLFQEQVNFYRDLRDELDEIKVK